MSQNINDLLKRCLQLRRLLRKSLEVKYPAYISSVRDWLRKRKTRAELDLEISAYLQQPVRKVHSEFLISLSKLCCGRLSLRLDAPHAQLAASPGDLVDLCGDSRSGQLIVDLSSDAEADQPDPFLLYKRIYTDRDMCGVELIKARFYLAAWDRGLSGIDSKVSRVLHYAMRHYIKNILHAAILHRGTKNSDSDKISGLDIWRSSVRTNYDLPAVPYSCSRSTHFGHENQENRPV